MPTPRFKFIIFLNTLDLTFAFFKNSLFLYYVKKLNYFSISYFFTFLKCFFCRQFMNRLNKTNLNLIGFYDNNVFKGTIFHTLRGLIIFIKNEDTKKIKNFSRESNLLFNLYFLSTKAVSSKINKKFYKNLFFYFFFFSTILWHQNTNFFKFYLNFIIVSTSSQISPFFNNYFLHIYNL